MSLKMVQRMTSTETTRTAHELMHGHTVVPIRNANNCCIWQDGTHLGDPEQLHLGPEKSHKPTSKGVKELFLHTEQRHGPQNGQADTG